MIAINQDPLGIQAERKIYNDTWNVFLKPLANGDYAVAIINRSSNAAAYQLNFADLGLTGKYEIRDLWEHAAAGKGTQWKSIIESHETKVFRLKKIL